MLGEHVGSCECCSEEETEGERLRQSHCEEMNPLVERGPRDDDKGSTRATA